MADDKPAQKSPLLRPRALVAGGLLLATLAIGATGDAAPVGIVQAGAALLQTIPAALIPGQDITISTRLDRTAVMAGGDGTVRMELVMAARQEKRGETRSVPTDLVLVLDSSGSMGGTKLRDAKAAIAEIISQLAPNDRFALITYGNDAGTLLPMAAPLATTRATWARELTQIRAGGGTNMSAGIDLAIREVAQNRQPGRTARVVLISDGHANAGDSSIVGLSTRAKTIARGENVLSAVGVGDGFNEVLMTSLADAGTGNYYFVDKGMQLAGTFKGEFDSARETIAAGVAVRLSPPEGVRVVDVAGYPLDRSGDQVIFNPGSLFAGQRRSVWVTYAVPTTSSGQEYGIGTVAVDYSPVGGGPRAEVHSSSLPLIACVARPEEFHAKVDKSVWEESAAVEEYHAMQSKVADAIRRGQQQEALNHVAEYESATAPINAVLGTAAVAKSLDDAKDLKRQVNDAFSGANQRAKQNLSSKALGSASRDLRRKGSKKF